MIVVAPSTALPPSGVVRNASSVRNNMVVRRCMMSHAPVPHGCTMNGAATILNGTVTGKVSLARWRSQPVRSSIRLLPSACSTLLTSTPPVAATRLE